MMDGRVIAALPERSRCRCSRSRFHRYRLRQHLLSRRFRSALRRGQFHDGLFYFLAAATSPSTSSILPPIIIILSSSVTYGCRSGLRRSPGYCRVLSQMHFAGLPHEALARWLRDFDLPSLASFLFRTRRRRQGQAHHFAEAPIFLICRVISPAPAED